MMDEKGLEKRMHIDTAGCLVTALTLGRHALHEGVRFRQGNTMIMDGEF